MLGTEFIQNQQNSALRLYFLSISGLIINSAENWQHEHAIDNMKYQAKMERWPLSKAIEAMKAFLDENGKGDIVIHSPDKKINPWMEKVNAFFDFLGNLCLFLSLQWIFFYSMLIDWAFQLEFF